VVEGRASLVHRRERTHLVPGTPARVSAGDVVETEGSGVAHVRLSEGANFELRDGSLEVIDGKTVSLQDGSMLVEAPQAAHVRVGGVTTRFTAGTLRFDGPAVGRIGAYEVQGLKIVKPDESSVDVPRYWHSRQRFR
jgi:hypothetical protein